MKQGEVASIANGIISTAKRVVAFRFARGEGKGIYVESMGTHLRDGDGLRVDSYISHGGETVNKRPTLVSQH